MNERKPQVNRREQRILKRKEYKKRAKEKAQSRREGWNLPLIGRNRFAQIGLAALALTLATICSPVGEQIQKILNPETGDYISNPDYPEMNRFKVKAVNTFVTPDSRQIIWFNYSGAQVNEENLRALYVFYEQPNLVPSDIFPGAQIRPSARKNITLNITSIDHPMPNLKQTDGLATISQINPRDELGLSFTPRDGQFTTYIRLDPKKYPGLDNYPGIEQLGPNSLLYVEACQTRLTVAASTLQEAILLRERLCNSMGYLVEQSSNNVPFDNVFVRLAGGSVAIGSNRVAFTPLPLDTYNRAKVIQRPLSR